MTAATDAAVALIHTEFPWEIDRAEAAGAEGKAASAVSAGPIRSAPKAARVDGTYRRPAEESGSNPGPSPLPPGLNKQNGRRGVAAPWCVGRSE